MIHLIQPRELFGPPERQEELIRVWEMNDKVFRTIKAPDYRPSFNDLFRLCDPFAVNVLANSDIYFDAEGVELMQRIKPGECWALSRWDVDCNGDATLWDHKDSADTWVIYGAPKVLSLPWTMGQPGVDNRLAWELINAGYDVKNPSKTIKSYHLHNVRWRSYLDIPSGRARGGNKSNIVPPPYAMVPTCTL